LIRNFLFNLDERVKLWMTVSAGAGAIYFVDWRLQAVVLGICLILCLLCGAGRFVIALAGFAGILSAFSWGYVRLGPEGSNFRGMGMYFILLKFGPLFLMMAFLQASLNTGRFLHLLGRMGFSSRWVIPLGACLRFLPSAAAECRRIRQAMHMRGISLLSHRMLRHPFETLEYMLVPLLARSLTVGEELARAAVARGIEAPGPRTSIHAFRFGPCDGMVLTIWTLALMVLLVLDNAMSAGGMDVGGLMAWRQMRC
jgi:energy-coupling factor transport system permease protein